MSIIDEDLVPELFVYTEVVPGDLLKLRAESNFSKTGGGARDLRFAKRHFRSVMHRIFTDIVDPVRGVRRATVTYQKAPGVPDTTTMEYWPPTQSRPSEERIARIHSSPALGGGLPPQSGRGRVFVTFTKYTNGVVRCDYAYEEDFRAGHWAEIISRQVCRCMNQVDEKNKNRKNPVSIDGYWDFMSMSGYCSGE